MEYRLCGWHVSCDTLNIVRGCRNSTCVSGCFCTDERILEDGLCVHPEYCPSKNVHYVFVVKKIDRHMQLDKFTLVMQIIFYLNILVSPAITDSTMDESRTIIEGNTTILRCEALGYPPPTIEWSKTNGASSVRVSVSDSVSVTIGYGNVTRVSTTLTITNTDVDDRGTYECTASNSVSSASRFFMISVDGMFALKISTWSDKRDL